MRRGGTVLALVVLLAALLPSSVLGADPPRAASISAPSSWIVTLDKSTNARTVAPRIASEAGGTAALVFDHALRGFVFHGTAKAARALARHPNVRHVVADRPVHIAVETVPPGVRRIRASHPTAPDAHEAGFTGTGIRVGILDTGIDLDHPDLVAGIDAGLGKNCMGPGAPEDGHGHGTHVAGTIAGRSGNGIGVVGVAPGARLVPFKVLNDAGEGSWATVICGIDQVTAYATDADPNNDIQVVNMSLGDVGPLGSCTDGGLREAICRSTAAGVVYVAAAGNSSTDASTFIPAAFPEVVTVSAMTDFDGERGGLAGCRFILPLFGLYCDDELAAFSNTGSVIDVTAPGVEVNSSWKGGGYQSSSGTSMAAPHVAGVAALVRAEDLTLTPAQVEELLKRTGEFPDGSAAEPNCGSTSQWDGDVDGIPEPLTNALRAAQQAANPTSSGLPVLAITAPAEGASVSGVVTIEATASDPDGIASVQFLVDGAPVGSDTNAPFEALWDTTSTFDSAHTITARATDTVGTFVCVHRVVEVGAKVQGDWVGTYGVDGYALASWNGTDPASDLVVLPTATLTLESGFRHRWAAATTDVRALESPSQAERRAGTWAGNNQLRLRLDFSAPYTGTLHVYVVDWDSTSRRQTMTVTDGTTSRTVPMATAYNGGAWLHFPISVPEGGLVRITGDYGAGYNPVVSGLFLGGAGEPPVPPPPPYEPGVQGDWVGTYGVDGYALASWNGTDPASDLVVLPTATLTLESGFRHRWAAATTDVRALESPSQAERRAGTWAGNNQLRLRLDFSAPYTGTLHVYVVDWDSTSRRQTMTVTDGTTSRTVPMATAYNGGAWLHFPISVPEGGLVRITGDYGAGYNPVVSGLFLGGAGEPPVPPPPPYEPGVQGDWVGTYGVDGYALASWNGTDPASDLVVLPTATLTLESGFRHRWAAATTDVRALESPSQAERRAGTWAGNNQLRLRLDFSAPYTGTLHVYVVDWDSTSRRQTMTVTDGTTSRTVPMATAYNGGAWLHFPISVPEGGLVRITGDYGAGYNPVVSGLFLGGAGEPPVPPPPPYEPGVQGDWVGTYGVDGYALASWNGTDPASDLVVLPTATLTLESGFRHRWAAATADVRALESPSQAERRAGTWAGNNQLRLRLDFSAPYTGTLHVYVVDWDSTSRRQTMTVTDGTTSRTVPMATAYNGGAWLHFPISVPEGGLVRITGDYGAGYNPVVSGLFLGDDRPRDEE